VSKAFGARGIRVSSRAKTRSVASKRKGPNEYKHLFSCPLAGLMGPSEKFHPDLRTLISLLSDKRSGKDA
jgi:hypothetical protein